MHTENNNNNNDNTSNNNDDYDNHNNNCQTMLNSVLFSVSQPRVFFTFLSFPRLTDRISPLGFHNDRHVPAEYCHTGISRDLQQVYGNVTFQLHMSIGVMSSRHI